jgi:diguanylate cyclase (GGDEF)-like protein
MMGKPISVRQVTWKYLTIMLVISLLAIFLIARVGWRAIEEDMQNHHKFESDVLQHQFSELLGFYQGIAGRLSRGIDVADILEFGDKERGVLWAKGARRLFPETVGVALVDRDGVLLGEPVELSLGTQCVIDLQHLFNGKSIPKPPVHRANQQLSHFDITQEVVRGGEVLGLIFISISLDVIQRRAERLIGDDKVLLIEGSDGMPVAVQGTDKPDEHSGSGHHWVAIKNSDWRLHLMTEESGASALFSSTLLSVGVFLVVTIILVVALSLKLISLFKKDLGLIKQQLDAVCSGQRQELPIDRTVLSETSDIMDDVWKLMGNIEQVNTRLKEQSVVDELSGLFNRRGFYQKLEESWERSQREVTASLILLDLDYFKRVNDSYGHGVGDQVIVAMAQALRERCRKTDVVARMGGDEFVVILNSTHGQQDVEQWYKGLSERFNVLQASCMVDTDKELCCTVSAGAVLIDKRHYDRFQYQFEAADRALYKAKQAGRGRLFFKPLGLRLASPLK